MPRARARGVYPRVQEGSNLADQDDRAGRRRPPARGTLVGQPSRIRGFVMRLRRSIALFATLLLLVSASPASAGYDPNSYTLSYALVVSGLDQPVYVTHAGDGSGRLFIVEKTGRIKILKNGQVLPTPFLNLSASVSRGSEQGLLGLAFHPE